MTRGYACPGWRRITSETRKGRPLCPCFAGTGAKIYASITCPRCHGTGGLGAPANAPVGPEATSSLSGGT